MSVLFPKAAGAAQPLRRRVLHIGSGPRGVHRLHSVFRDISVWQEIRLDLDPDVAPEIECSISDMSLHVADGSIDAVWSSHNIEHLPDHEIPRAFSEVMRVLSPTGFFLIRCPDILAIAEAILADGLDTVAYEAPAGPITPLDMLYGHRQSIARGKVLMEHRTGFTDLRLGRLLIEAGFVEVRTKRREFDLYAVAFKSETTSATGIAELARHGLTFEE